MAQGDSPSHASTTDVADRLTSVQHRLASAAEEYGREPAGIQLIAVSKTKPLALIEAAARAGQTHFGENYLQEALDKIRASEDPTRQWHFIGDIQSNKTRDIAGHFAWAHAVNRFKIARRLSEQRPEALPPLNICIQINIDDEASKAGVSPDQARALASQIAELPNLHLRGLMALPAYREDFASRRRPFAALRRLKAQINSDGLALDTLSMGMSADLEAAVAEGATHVRVGSAIFGPRSS